MHASSSDHEGKESAIERVVAAPITTAGITVYVRKSTGITKHLNTRSGFITLLDGPYLNNPTGEVLGSDRLILIGGGIGITGLIGYAHAHVNVRIAWSMKQTDAAVATDLDTVLSSVAEKEIRIGERLDIETLLKEEAAAGYGKVGVVVCGPDGMCDDVRAIVAGLGRHGKTVFALDVHAYSW